MNFRERISERSLGGGISEGNLGENNEKIPAKILDERQEIYLKKFRNNSLKKSRRGSLVESREQPLRKIHAGMSENIPEEISEESPK